MVTIKFYCDHRNRSPVIEWLQSADKELKAKVIARIQELAELGHQLDRPHAEHVEGDIYALRISGKSGQHRVFYFFYDQAAAVLTHAHHKKTGKIPPEEISKAKEMRKKYLSAPDRHAYKKGYEP